MSNKQPLIILEGVRKRLEIYDDRVVIRRTDALATLMPVGFGGQTMVYLNQIARADLYEPEPLRLDECDDTGLQLVITRRDHTTLSLTLNREERQAAQDIRAYIAARSAGAPSESSSQNSPA